MEPDQIPNEIIETAPDFENLGESSGFNDDMSHNDMDIDDGPVMSLDDFLVEVPNEEEKTSKDLVDLDQTESLAKSPISSSSSSVATLEPSAATSSSELPNDDCNDLDKFQGDQNQKFRFHMALWK